MGEFKEVIIIIIIIIILIGGYDLVRAVDSFVFSSYICGFALILSYIGLVFLVSTARATFADHVDPFVDSGDDLFSLF